MQFSRKTTTFGMCLLTVILALAMPIWASGDSGEITKGQALGNQVAGSYLLSFTPSSPLASFQGLVTISSDGTAILTETTDFGFGNPAVFGFNSPTHGAWKKTGKREIGTRMLFFNYSDDGTPEVIVRVETTWTFERRYDDFDGPFSLEVFTLSQDPLDPSETPVAVITGQMSGRRITVD